MKIVTNALGVPSRWSTPDSYSVDAIHAQTLGEFVDALRTCDLALVHGNVPLLLKLCLCSIALPWLWRKKIVASDIVLMAPINLRSRLLLPFRRVLLWRVNHFLHLFRDVSGYRKYYGIGPERSSFTAFKANLKSKIDVAPDSDGEYVLCIGWSRRDYDTFFDAMERLPYPAAIPKPLFAQLRSHGSRFSRSLGALPRNVRVLDHDPESNQSQVDVLKGAKLVVFPFRKENLGMSGIAYNAMLLGKCVILTEGPAVNGLFTDQVVPVPVENATALAAVIERCWQDDALRRRTAEAGCRLANSLGTEAEYIGRILEQTARYFRGIKMEPNWDCFT